MTNKVWLLFSKQMDFLPDLLIQSAKMVLSAIFFKWTLRVFAAFFNVVK